MLIIVKIYPKNYECGKLIHDIKFSPDCSSLVAACENGIVYVFSMTTKNYFSEEP